MSLIDPKNANRWCDGTPRSTCNGFVLGYSDEPVNWKPLQRAASLRQTSSATIAEARANGKDRSTMFGISKKADRRIAQQAQSFSIEPRAAAQKSADKRDALRRGGI